MHLFNTRHNATARFTQTFGMVPQQPMQPMGMAPQQPAFGMPPQQQMGMGMPPQQQLMGQPQPVAPPALSSPQVRRQQQAVCVAKLQAAIQSMEKGELEAALAESARLNYTGRERTTAQQLLSEFTEAEQREQLKQVSDRVAPPSQY